MTAPSVSLRPLVSWPEEVEAGRKYMVTVDVEFDAESSPWPYDSEEYAIGCMVEGEPRLAVESVGDTTLVLHRFGGTYGPARFVTYAVGDGPPGQDTALHLTLITAGGVPFRSERLAVRVGRTEVAPPVPEIDVALAGEGVAEQPSGAGPAEGSARETTGTVLVLPGSGLIRGVVSRRLRNVERRTYGWRHQVEVGDLPGTAWRVALLLNTWSRPEDEDQSVVATVGREFRAPFIVSVVQGSEAHGRTDQGDVVVATQVSRLPGTLTQPSDHLVRVARVALLSSAHFAPVAGGGTSRHDGSGAHVSGENNACLRTAYAVRGGENLTVCAIGEVAVDRAVEAMVAVLARVPPDVDPLALPALPEQFVGRGDELRELLGLLDPSSHSTTRPNVVVLRGMPGIGKTTLAAAVAHKALESGRFTGGVYWVTRDTDAREAVREARSRLRDDHGPVLFVHDAAKPHPWEALEDGRIHVLVTRRRGAPSPSSGTAVTLQPLTVDAALELLPYDPTEAAVQLAALCGGVPLALHLAARRPGPYDELLLDIDEAGGIFGVLDELRDAFDTEYRMLPFSQQKSLRSLALLPGGFGGELIGGSFDDDVRLGLEPLVDAGLVAQHGSPMRWYLPTLVRAYVEQIPADSRAMRLWLNTAGDALWSFCASRTEDAVACLGLGAREADDERHGRRAEALAWLDGEHENLVAVVRVSPLRAEREAVDFVIHLGAYLNWRRYFDDCVACCSAVLQPEEESQEMAQVWNVLGAAQRGLGLLEQAAESHRRAQTIFGRFGDTWGDAKACDALGLVHADQGDLEAARRLHIAARDTLQYFDRRGEAEATMNLGMVTLRQGNAAEALDQLAQAVELYQLRGDVLGLSRAALNRAEALVGTGGSPEQAAAIVTELMRDFADLDDTHGMARAWDIRARAYEELDRYDETLSAWSQAERRYVASRDEGRAGLVRERARNLRERTTRPDRRVLVTLSTSGIRASSVRWAVQVSGASAWELVDGSGSGIDAFSPDLPRQLREPLLRALEMAESVDRPVPIEVALPAQYFDLAPHAWLEDLVRTPEYLGGQRPVVLRDAARAGRQDPAWLSRWRALRPAAHLAAWHLPVPRGQAGFPIPEGHIPVLCGPVSRGPGKQIMSRLLKEGHGVVLWTSEPHPKVCGPGCDELRAQADGLLADVRSLEELPHALWRFRAASRDFRLSLLYDDPTAPLPGPRRIRA